MKKAINGILEMVLNLPPNHIKPEHKMVEDLSVADNDMYEIQYYLDNDLDLIINNDYPRATDYETVQDLYDRIEEDCLIKLKE